MTDPRTVLVELEGEDRLDASQAVTLRTALQAALTGAPTIRRAALYGIARGDMVLRLMTGGGWIPVVIVPADWSDADVLASRLRAALTASH